VQKHAVDKGLYPEYIKNSGNNGKKTILRIRRKG
jgi:hypothetical protein